MSISKKIAYSISTLLMIGGLVSGAWSNTINASNCSQASVQTAINSAQPGDTVFVPAGNSVWGSPVKINTQKITLMGAGIGGTVITGNGNIIVTNGENGNNLRITGIELRQCNSCIAAYGGGMPVQAVKNIRIDHCKFVRAQYVYETRGGSTGVIDHCNFVDSYGGQLYGSNDPSGKFPIPLGTSDAVFFEDNLIQVTSSGNPAHFIASNSWSKYVVRHNTFDYKASLWDIVDAHGYCEVQGRGSATWEIYANTFNLCPTIDRVIHIRGGQGVVFDNVFTGYNPKLPISLTNYSSCRPPCVQPVCTTYPCKDQITNSYFWNNRAPNGPVDPTVNCSTVGLNRDYFTKMMPGYVPYQYPHPLASSDGDINNHPLSVRMQQSLSKSDIIFEHRPGSVKASVSYGLERKTPVSVGIYNVDGSLVQNLVSGTQSAGSHTVSWDASKVPKKIYVFMVKLGQNSKSFRFTNY